MAIYYSIDNPVALNRTVLDVFVEGTIVVGIDETTGKEITKPKRYEVAPCNGK